jgi:hypothetical protein
MTVREDAQEQEVGRDKRQEQKVLALHVAPLYAAVLSLILPHAHADHASSSVSRWVKRKETLGQIKVYLEATRTRSGEGILRLAHSHSMVPGGLLVMSRATRFTPGTSFMIRLLMRSRRS